MIARTAVKTKNFIKINIDQAFANSEDYKVTTCMQERWKVVHFKPLVIR